MARIAVSRKGLVAAALSWSGGGPGVDGEHRQGHLGHSRRWSDAIVARFPVIDVRVPRSHACASALRLEPVLNRRAAARRSRANQDDERYRGPLFSPESSIHVTKPDARLRHRGLPSSNSSAVTSGIVVTES